MKIELSKFQLNNLIQFLNRAELKGIDEANALLELVNIIQNAETPNKNDNQQINGKE